MKKIVFGTICLQKLNPVYSAKQKDIFIDSTYEEKVYYPINAVLANDLQKDDEIKVVLIKTRDDGNPNWEKNFNENAEKFTSELRKICSLKEVKSNVDSPVIVETDFKETQDIFEQRFMDFFEVLEEDCELYTDMTFGSRITALILTNVLSFAEKFFNSEIKSVVYGKTSFVPDPMDATKRIPQPGTVYDISSLYFLNNLTNVVRANSGKEAIEAFKSFLGK